jgi:hypothetical protein
VNLGACRKLDQSPETGVWYRAVRLAHLTTPINTAHTKSTPSRFSPGPSANPPFEILYLSESPQVAQFEIGALAGDPLVVGGILNARGSFAAIEYQRNLIVFPEKMFRGSRLEFRDASAHLLQEIDGTVPKTARRGWSP